MKTIFENDNFIVDYNEATNEYRVSYFENNHFVDDCKFKSIELEENRMSNLHTLYSIVPVEDKCSILCEDVNGTHFTISKGSISSKINGVKLLFTSAERAQKYINCNLETTKFFVEEFGGNDDLYNIAF